MSRSKKRVPKKLSDKIPLIVQKKLTGKLTAIRQLIRDSGEIAEDISKIATHLRQETGSDKTACNETIYELSSLSRSLDLNIRSFDRLLSNDDMFVKRLIENQTDSSIRGCVLFFDGMTDKDVINTNIIQPFIQNTDLKSSTDLIDIIKKQVITVQSIEKTSDIEKLIDMLYNGYSIFLLEGFSEALAISSQGMQARQISEPENEKVLRGPREGFTETLSTNLSLIKKRLRTPDLKIKFRTLGEKTHTKICICYIAGIANAKILTELYSRLDKINIDGILDSAYIAELITDSPYTPFETLGNTERPDIVAAKLLEGRIAVLVDGTPEAITVPYIFIEYFQSNDDYYINYLYSSVGRLIRIFSFIATISAPAIYISLVTYHQELIPVSLMFNISAAREGVPFPTVLETTIVLMLFEILRETGLHMPSTMGQSLSIVGGLVIGQAAVEARFVSAPIVIIAGFAGITGLMIPRIKGATIFLRFLLVLLASVLGLYGVIFGICGVLIHLFELRSFGVPYMYMLLFLDPAKNIRDTVIRAPWWLLEYRQRLFSSNRLRNQTKRGNKLWGASKPDSQ